MVRLQVYSVLLHSFQPWNFSCIAFSHTRPPVEQPSQNWLPGVGGVHLGPTKVGGWRGSGKGAPVTGAQTNSHTTSKEQWGGWVPNGWVLVRAYPDEVSWGLYGGGCSRELFPQYFHGCIFFLGGG